MRYVVAETWGLCGFRRVGSAAKPPHEPFYGFGTEVDPGRWTQVGDWWSLQDGMVSGPYETRREAREALKENRIEDFTDDRGNVGRLTKVLRRYKGGKVTLALFKLE